MNLEKAKALHVRAVQTSQLYKKCEAELIEILQEIDKQKAYLHLGATSLYEYSTKILKLSESVSYQLMSVARKSREVPALKEAIKTGEITVSKAHKIVSVVNPANQDTWLQIAKTKTSREIEKAVAQINPQALIHESVKYRTEDRIELKVGISEKVLKKLERVIDLESQRTSKAASREDALLAALDLYLERNDPLKKAERHFARIENNKLAVAPSSVSTSSNTKMFTGTVESLNEASSLIAATTESQTKNQSQTQGPTQAKTTATAESIANTHSSPSGKIPIRALKNKLENKLNDKKPLNQVIQRSTQNSFRKRKSLPSALIHAVHMRDQRRCTYIQKDGHRCESTRWLDTHHKTPVYLGGKDILENLTTVCSQHHKLIHHSQTHGKTGSDGGFLTFLS